MHAFINLIKFTRTQNLAFVHTNTFRMKSTDSFINETPDVYLVTNKHSFALVFENTEDL